MAENEINLIDIESASSQECDKSNLSESKLKTRNCWKWDNFEVIGDKTKIKCKFCDTQYSAKTSVNALKKHITRHEKPKNVVLIEIFFKHQNEKTFGDYLIEFIIKGQHPFSIVSKPSFISMIKSIKPDVIIPSRITIQRNCLQKYNDLKEKIIIEMNNLNWKGSFTTHMWTSISQQPYVSTTAHYFHNKELQHLLLDFSLIPYPHKGEDIKIKVQEVIQEFGLLDKIIAITTDNASNNIKGIQELQLWLNENYNTPEIYISTVLHI